MPYFPSPRTGDRISDLLMQQGQIQAQGAQRSGDIWGNTIGGLGQIVGGALEHYGQQKKIDVLNRQDQVATRRIMEWNGKDPQELLKALIDVKGPVEGQKLAQGVLSFRDLTDARDEKNFTNIKSIGETAAGMKYPMFEQFYPALRSKAPIIEKHFGMAPGTLPEAPTPEIHQYIQSLFGPKGEAYTLAPGGQRRGPNNEVLAENPAEAPTPSFQAKDVLLDGRPTMANFDSRTGRFMIGDQDVTARVRPIPPQGPQNPVAVMGDDGKPIYVTPGQALGKRPASQREQGRPVTSGDAGRIADLDTSLDDLNKLTGAVTGSKATGTAAKIGAAVPNWVTEWTGMGADAKSKQAVIDRVKQVIGKALEGGVLRKEDEYKYEKILPTIGDVPQVVKAKLDGLWSAIQQRKTTQLEALSDAGYDVGKYEARAPRERVGATGAAPIVQRNSDTGEYRHSTDGGKTWRSGKP